MGATDRRQKAWEWEWEWAASAGESDMAELSRARSVGRVVRLNPPCRRGPSAQQKAWLFCLNSGRSDRCITRNPPDRRYASSHMPKPAGSCGKTPRRFSNGRVSEICMAEVTGSGDCRHFFLTPCRVRSHQVATIHASQYRPKGHLWRNPMSKSLFQRLGLLAATALTAVTLVACGG